MCFWKYSKMYHNLRESLWSLRGAALGVQRSSIKIPEWLGNSIPDVLPSTYCSSGLVLSPERRFGACPEILSTGLDATKAKTIIQTTMDIFAGWRIGLGAKETKTFLQKWQRIIPTSPHKAGDQMWLDWLMVTQLPSHVFNCQSSWKKRDIIDPPPALPG